MIIPMKKITLLCLDTDKVRTLEALRDLSIMHTAVAANVETADVATLSKRLADVNRAGLALLEYKNRRGTAPAGAEEAVTRVNAILDERATVEKSLEALNKEYQKDFFAEGQYFYFLKRHNYKTFWRCPVEKMDYYVLPTPDDEIAYGNGK